MNLKTILAAVFALFVGIGGTAAYFYFDRLNDARNAPPIPPAKVETPAETKSPAPPAPPANAANSNTVAPVNSVNSNVKNGALKDEDLSLGGVSYGASINDVRAVHGEPYKIEDKRKWRGTRAVVYDYANLFDLYVVDGIVRCIKIDHLNGLATTKNISVGSSANDVIAAYGEPSMRDKDHFVYQAANNPTIGIEFEIEHGFVEEIRVGMLK